MEKLIEENPAAAEWLPENKPDGSGIGANYVDAFLKPLNCELEDELRLACKRRGLKITVSVGDRKGEAILRRIEHGPDVKCHPPRRADRGIRPGRRKVRARRRQHPGGILSIFF